MTHYSLDKKEKIAQILRINHAGEYAAIHIYEGQKNHISCSNAKSDIESMAASEAVHLEYFEKELRNRRIRPTLLQPIIKQVFYALGAATAKLGPKQAMICTSAVEEVIAEHYQDQVSKLGPEEEALKNDIEKIRQEELDHKHVADDYTQTPTLFDTILSTSIKAGCKIAIKAVQYL